MAGGGRASGRAGGSSARAGGAAAVKGIALLQGAVGNARTDQLQSAWDALDKKPIASMSNEEKMVRAVTTDELSKRGKLIYDPKSSSYSKTKEKNIVNTEDRSYRVKGISLESQGGEAESVANAEMYYNGSWKPVKNFAIRKKIAELYRKK